MKQKQHKRGWGSFSWVLIVILGIAMAWNSIWSTFEALTTQPVDWELVLVNLADVAVWVILCGLVFLMGWLLSDKKKPSLAFVMTLLIGCFFFIHSLGHVVEGFLSEPIDMTAAVGGLIQLLVFVLLLFVTAWLLLFRPKVGAVVLICAGAALGVRMGFEFKFSWTLDYLLFPVLIAGLPIYFGVHTLIRENIARKGQPTLKNTD